MLIRRNISALYYANWMAYKLEVYIGSGSDINGQPNKPEHEPIPERRKPDDANPIRQ